MAFDDLVSICGIPLLIFGFFFALSMVRIIYQYEKGIVFRLGKYHKTLDPGLRFIIPGVDDLRKIDMRIRTLDIPKQEGMTKDNIPVMVNAVVYYKVENPESVILKIERFQFAVAQYTQAALRDIIGNNELDFVLIERDKVAQEIKKIVDVETSEWGIDITSIKIQEIELPAEMKRAMARQAEAERDKRGQIIVSEGEFKESENLRKAAENLSKSPASIHLRTLQTIREIAQDPSEKVIILVPSDFGEIVKKFVK